MNEKPILFSTDMVKAILDGRKTQTRRVIKPQPTDAGLEFATACEGEFSAWQDDGLNLDEHSEDGGPCQRICPYGQVGDRLWVRETAWYGPQEKRVEYLADNNKVAEDNAIFYGAIKKSSIFMPRWASRITLEIIKIRVEKIQEIEAYDCEKEGIVREYFDSASQIISKFEQLWNSINAKHGYSWDTNCWVWAIEFKVIKNE